MEKICDICGTKFVEGPNYCGGCGADLNDKGEILTPKDSKKKEPSPKKKKSINPEENTTTWCQIHSLLSSHELTPPSFLKLILLLFSEGKYLGFCDCNRCNLGYRQLYAEMINVTEDKNLNPNSREVVSKFYNVDISQKRINFSNIFDIQSPKEEESIGYEYRTDNKGKGKISIDIDKDILENLLFDILSSEIGQDLIKKTLK